MSKCHKLSIKLKEIKHHWENNFEVGQREISSQEFAYGLACALAESTMQNGHAYIAEENYEDYTAQSPFHQAENCWTAAGVVLYWGTLGRPPFHGRDMVGPGSKMHLFNTALALHYTGFEQPTLYAELGGPLFCENEYHFFRSTPHLCVITGAFWNWACTRNTEERTRQNRNWIWIARSKSVR
jgi:hypothetical protein